MHNLAEEMLLNPGPDVLIADEGHRIKNDKTAMSIILKKVRTKRRAVLTGSEFGTHVFRACLRFNF